MSKEEIVKQRMEIMEKHMAKTEKSDCFEVFFDYQKAMQEYSDQNTKPLNDEIEKLNVIIDELREQKVELQDKLKASKSEANEAKFKSEDEWLELIKQLFFKRFGNQSFKGYPLEQCNEIWDFFAAHLKDNNPK